jgi:hypothetical protein
MGLMTGITEYAAMHYKQKELQLFHVEQLNLHQTKSRKSKKSKVDSSATLRMTNRSGRAKKRATAYAVTL